MTNPPLPSPQAPKPPAPNSTLSSLKPSGSGNVPAATPGTPPAPMKPPTPPTPSAPALPPRPQPPAMPPASSMPPSMPPAPSPVVPPGPPIRPPAPTLGSVRPGATVAAGAPPLAPAPAGAPPTTPGAVPAGKAPLSAQVKGSPLKWLPFVLIGLVVMGIIGFILMRVLGGSKPQSVSTTPTASPGTGSNRNTVPGQQTTLTYWGLWEPSEVLSEVLDEFESQNPGIKVEYVKQSPTDYRERLQTAIASGKGPDLYRFHASWTPMLKNELASMPTTVYSPSEFDSTFYKVAKDQLSIGGQLVGVPLMYDGLALYYNKDLLKSANASPPTTWAELRTLANQLTIRSGETVQRGGLAIGNASNVEHFADIIGLLMLQNGADLTKPTGAEARDALLFYTNFAKTDKVWSESLPSSTVAFARGDVAMMFAPSWRAHEVKAQNPNLNFGIAPLPKLGEDRVTWASYWAEGVSAQSKNKDASWKLIKYLSSAETMKKLYSSQSQVRAFGEPYSRVGLATELASNELVAPYLSDAETAKGWYMSSMTHDNGINDQLIKYYQDAVNAILSGKDVDGVLTTLSQGTTQVLRQYGVSTTGSSATTGTTNR